MSNHTITNTIKCINLNFMGGQANAFINVPFLVNEIQIVGLSFQLPQAQAVLPILQTSTSTFTASITGTVMTVTTTPSTSILQNMSLAGTGVTANTFVVSQLSGIPSGIGTYTISAIQTVASTPITGTLNIPLPYTEIQGVIYSNLLPYNDNPIGYLNEYIAGIETSTTCSNIIYHFPQPKPIMGNFQFNMKDYLGNGMVYGFNAIVFIDFRLRSNTIN